MTDFLNLFSLCLHTQGDGVNRWISLHNSQSLEMDNYSYRMAGSVDTGSGTGAAKWCYRSGLFVFLDQSSKTGPCNVLYTHGITMKHRFCPEIHRAMSQMDE